MEARELWSAEVLEVLERGNYGSAEIMEAGIMEYTVFYTILGHFRSRKRGMGAE